MPDEPVCGHLAVVSHVIHHRWNGRIFAYTPYARELDLWASMVERLTVVAPVRDSPPPPDATALAAENVVLAPQIEAGGDDRRAKLAQLLRLPAMVWGVDRAIRDADAVQVRCPGNLGLIGAVVAPLRSGRVMAKYAGQWRGFDGEPSAWRLQRAILRSRWFRGPVLAYGPRPTDGMHVLPAFSSAVDGAALARAAEVAAGRSTRRGPLRVVFVGRLTAAKHVDAVIEAVHRAESSGPEKGVEISLRIVGDGPEREALQALADSIGTSVVLVGAIAQDRVFEEYAAADVLVLASESEGWPKAIVEAMAFGVVCIGNDQGMVPAILGGGRGSTVRSGDVEQIAAALVRLAGDREELRTRSEVSAEWASRFSLEAFEREMRRMLAVAWGAPRPVLQPPTLRGVVPVLAPAAADEPEGEPLRVLQVVDSLAAGGAEQVAVHLANELARSGHESTLVATRASGPLADAIDPAVSWRSFARTGRFDLSAIASLRAVVADRQIQVIHAHSTSIFLVVASFPVGPRPAIVWHDHFPGAAHRNPWPLRAVGRWIDAAVAVSHDIETADRRFLRLGDRLVRVPNFSVLEVDAPPATDLPGRPGARIVCVANLREVKDQVTLVRAMAEVVPGRPDAHLLLVGANDGPYADQVRAEIGRQGLDDRVSLLGVRTDVGSLLAACDVGVLSSTEEGTPLAVLEYGLAGLAVVATAVGEVADVVGESGRLVQPGDAETMARQLADLLDDPVERSRIGSGLQARINRHHSSTAIRRLWEDVYRTAAGRRRAIESR